jgi:predicted glycosyltransferase
VWSPRVSPRTEQLIRARAFEQLGLLRVLEPSQLTSERLRAEIATVLGTVRDDLKARAAKLIHFDGAQRAARQLLELAAARVAS